MTRVYLDIVGDLIHVGHINLFINAKNLFRDVYLIVGVHSDKDTESYKRKPVIAEEQRYKMIKYCRLVDEVIEAAPLTITKKFINKHKIDYVVHGNDITPELKKQHKVPIDMKIVKYVEYTKGISTTKIIKKIELNSKSIFSLLKGYLYESINKEIMMKLGSLKNGTLETLIKPKEWTKDIDTLVLQICNFLDITDYYGKNNLRMLEIGFGNGRSTYLLSPFFSEIIGVESNYRHNRSWRNPGLALVSQELGDKFKFNCNVKDIGYLLKENSLFDCICFYQLTYLDSSNAKSCDSIDAIFSKFIYDLKVLRKILKPNGYICLTFARERLKLNSTIEKIDRLKKDKILKDYIVKLNSVEFDLIDHDYDDMIILRAK